MKDWQDTIKEVKAREEKDSKKPDLEKEGDVPLVEEIEIPTEEEEEKKEFDGVDNTEDIKKGEEGKYGI